MDNQLDVLGISHLGLAVTRLEQFIDTWGLVLGISDWWIRDDVEESGVEVGGVPQEDLRVRLGYARLGGLCIELVETVTGETCHSESAEVFGPGLHHVAFWVNDLDKEVEKALSMGLTIAMAPSALVARVRGAVALPTAGDLLDRAGPEPRERSLYSFLMTQQPRFNFTLELLDVHFLDEYQALTGDKPTRPPAHDGEGASA